MQTFAASVQQAVNKLDKDMPVSNLRPQMEYVEKARAQTRFVTLLAGALAALALFLACIGIYGVTSYSVAQRNREIAIRIVVGPNSPDVRRMVLRKTGLPLVVGLAAAFAMPPVPPPPLPGL